MRIRLEAGHARLRHVAADHLHVALLGLLAVLDIVTELGLDRGRRQLEEVSPIVGEPVVRPRILDQLCDASLILVEDAQLLLA